MQTYHYDIARMAISAAPCLLGRLFNLSVLAAIAGENYSELINNSQTERER